MQQQEATKFKKIDCENDIKVMVFIYDCIVDLNYLFYKAYHFFKI